MKKLLTLAAVVAITGGVQAANIIWQGDAGGGDGTNWVTSANWVGSVAPGSDDVVYLDGVADGAPVLDTNGQVISAMIIGNNNDSTLTLFGGDGSLMLQTQGACYVGNAAAGTLTINDDAYMVAGALNFGLASSTGTVNLNDNAILLAGSLTYMNGDVVSQINLADNARFRINGDQLGAGYENSRILTSQGGFEIDANLISGGTVTEYTVVAIPEPATLGMIGLFGGSILFIRRKFMI